ncbi:MAG TPA: DUF1080 domain-containing protein [Bryobacteraceae bacterium]|nr:DUF1080 domain-containing protein [Bryobacteraceae bacterium]
MRTLILLPILLLGGTSTAHSQAVPRGWRPLFNGKDLDGWAVVGAQGKPAFTVEDGEIRTQSGDGLLCYTREKLGNVTLRVIYRMENSKGAGGILIRLPGPASIPNAMEVRIDDRGDERHVTGVIDSSTQALSRAVKMEGEWNTMDITMQGSRTIVKLNGALVSDYDGSRIAAPESGYIALRPPDDRAAVWIREISVRP